MRRFANTDWTVPTAIDNKNQIASWDAVKIALLMDIRDELQKLNRLLHCSNFVGIPTTLRSIRRAMPVKRKAVKK